MFFLGKSTFSKDFCSPSDPMPMGGPLGPPDLSKSPGSWCRWHLENVRKWQQRLGGSSQYPLVMTNIAMENPYKWRFRSLGKSSISIWAIYAMAMLNNNRVVQCRARRAPVYDSYNV